MQNRIFVNVASALNDPKIITHMLNYYQIVSIFTQFCSTISPFPDLIFVFRIGYNGEFKMLKNNLLKIGIPKLVQRRRKKFRTIMKTFSNDLSEE